uniref:NADH dehydrogenase subunit 3 n=1 Tax=Nesophrosyne sp. 242 GMB-2012 TaxID=1223954 RepID=UPI00218212E3|nr:NADH dehydrogenase subunit 3 [Nesophrosyne sp. 242 GMB-2012]UVI59796.1 NADH dehydrogenase subunit 3 [Nesophrosyne sp. 242 GMB-2012]
MNLMTYSLLLIMLMMLILMSITSIISKKSIIDNQKATPFECGFNPVSYTRLPFSMHFFLIAVLFLVFDIEIIMVLPMILTVKTALMKTWILTTSLFIMILLLGLFHEWNNGMIKWTE